MTTRIRPTAFPVAEQEKFLTAIRAQCGTDVMSKKEILDFAEQNGYPPPGFIFTNKARNVSRGQYFLGNTVTQVVAAVSPVEEMITQIEAIKIATESSSLPPRPDTLPLYTAHIKKPEIEVIQPAEDSALQFIPEVDDTYIPFGFYTDIKTIVRSKMFYPVYITGLSGNGKTLSILQVHAQLKKPLIRVNITKDTDEFDLYGSFELVNGNTVMRVGPVFMAMEMGATLLLDEVDYGSEKLLCLQPALENRPIFDKKRKKMVHPKPGFNVMCTANTKGKGDLSGKFIGANILNEAFLERFPLTVEQVYPSKDIESRIIYANFKTLGVDRTPDIERITGDLIKWAANIRQAYENEGVLEVISTRRIVNIVKTYTIFGDLDKAINLCISRFDPETKASMKDFYDKCKTPISVVNGQPNTTAKATSIAVTTPAPAGSPIAGDPRYSRLSASMVKRFGVSVVLRNYNGNIEAYSHDYLTYFGESTVKPIEIDPAQFEKEIVSAITLNETAKRKSMLGASFP